MILEFNYKLWIVIIKINDWNLNYSLNQSQLFLFIIIITLSSDLITQIVASFCLVLWQGIN